MTQNHHSLEEREKASNQINKISMTAEAIIVFCYGLFQEIKIQYYGQEKWQSWIELQKTGDLEEIRLRNSSGPSS